MSFDPRQPYNDLPLLPPQADIETKNILRLAIEANRSLAKLNGKLEIIPNPTILVNALTLQEAKASSEIENIFTTNDALYKGLSKESEKTDPQTKEVLRYRDALWNGYEDMKKRPFLSTNLFIEIVQRLKMNQAGIRQTPGTTINNGTIAIYTPPEGESIIRDKLKNLEVYINNSEDKTDPLIKLAVIHYQFEAIHPFGDGNGRTGRIINILYLTMLGLLELPVLYLSEYIINNKNQYYQLLKNVTENQAWEDWIIFILTALHNTSENTLLKIERIKKLLDDTINSVKEKIPKVYTRELVDLLFMNPYIRIKNLVENNIAERKTASEYLQAIEKLGILQSRKEGNEYIFLNSPLIEVLKQ